MWWAMDLDDFSGAVCGQGQYPLISGTGRKTKVFQSYCKKKLEIKKIWKFWKIWKNFLKK